MPFIVVTADSVKDARTDLRASFGLEFEMARSISTWLESEPAQEYLRFALNLVCEAVIWYL